MKITNDRGESRNLKIFYPYDRNLVFKTRRDIQRQRKSRLNSQRNDEGKEKEKYIAIIHYKFHQSFTVIDNTRKKVSTYDSGVQIGGATRNLTRY